MERYNKNIGDFGEECARRYLERLGYKILLTNYNCKFGEIDIIALDNNCLVFIEVKTRTSLKYGAPEYSVNYWKRKHLSLSARCYIDQYRMKEYFARFDVVEVFAKNADNNFSIEKINIIKNAFWLGDDTLRIYDIIANKRDKKELTREEIEFFVDGVTNGTIEDYQITALLMAIYLNGMTKKETSNLTMAMANSGDVADLSKINGIKVDKHSTGGVGDKTTLVVAPLVSSFGVPVAKMSGRGLGHTGGTVDKLESIPGFNIAMPIENFIENVNSINIAVVGQTGDLAPADKKLYALRDVTATVSSIPLIASSIMSKKIAGGADAIVLDVKYGSGAFMKTLEDATLLAQTMVDIGADVGRKTIAVISNMNEPLGLAIGNSLEVKEAIETLHGRGPKDFEEICIELAAQMLYLAGKGEVNELKVELHNRLNNGVAFSKFKEFIMAQGGDVLTIENTDLLPSESKKVYFAAESNGYISGIEAEKLGVASMLLGGGRAKKTDDIDYGVGIVLNKKVGEYVEKGTVLATLFVNDEGKLLDVIELLKDAFCFSESASEKLPLIAKIVE